MPNRDNWKHGAKPELAPQDSLAELWQHVFSETGTLSGFCLEWLLDKAECSKGRKS